MVAWPSGDTLAAAYSVTVMVLARLFVGLVISAWVATRSFKPSTASHLVHADNGCGPPHLMHK